MFNSVTDWYQTINRLYENKKIHHVHKKISIKEDDLHAHICIKIKKPTVLSEKWMS